MIPRNWRLQQQRYRLAAKTCEHCNKMIFPPRNICPACAAEASRFSSDFSIPVAIVKCETQSGDVTKVLSYGYRPQLVAAATVTK